MRKGEKTSLAIVWSGLPLYAADLIQADIQAYPGSVTVVGSRPMVPLVGIEERVGQPVHWIDPIRRCSWSDLGISVPNHLIVSGWGLPAFNALATEVHAKGGRVVAMVDNCWKGNWKQLLGAIYARLKLRPRIDAVWVPGKSALRLVQFLGWKKTQVYRNLYSALDEFGADFASQNARSKTFLFVGQLIHRKGVDLLAAAWTGTRLWELGWTLVVCGDGPERYRFEGLPGVELCGFVQPLELSRRVRSATWFVLPAREEHWGLVVHEAARCGCGLLLSDEVGSRFEFLESGRNGFQFRSADATDLERTLLLAANQDVMFLESCYNLSKSLGGQISRLTHQSEFRRICREVFRVEPN